MSTKSQNVMICSLLMASVLLSACTPRGLISPTSTPTLTDTPSQTPSPTPSSTSTPTLTKTPVPTPDLRTRNPENSHLYLYVEMAKTWHGASTYCRSRGGHLVTIESASENDFVYELSKGNTWLGASDEAQEGTWVWVTGEQLIYTNWEKDEPNNCCPPESCGGADCIPEHFLTYKYDTYWNDVPTNTRMPFVCEWADTSP